MGYASGEASDDHGRRSMRTRQWMGTALPTPVPAGLAVVRVGAALPAGATGVAPGPMVRVVVTGAPGAQPAVAAAVTAVGGKVEAELGVVDGVSADVPASAVNALRQA